MARLVPPKYFYKLSQEQQEEEAVKRMNDCYDEGDRWKRLAQQARKKHIPEPDERPDEESLKQ